MEIFVLNLKSSRKRREAITGQLDRQGLRYRVFDAVDGRALSPEAVARVCDPEAVVRFGLSRAQIGCALSKYQIYRTIVDEGIDSALMLEDDLILSNDFSRMLPEIEAQLREEEMIFLHFTPGAGCQLTTANEARLSDPYVLRYPMHPETVLGHVACMLRRPLAQRLADAVFPIGMCADWWGQFHQSGALTSMRCLSPALVQLNPGFPSEIGLGQVKHGLFRRGLAFCEKYHVAPVQQLRAWNRRRVSAQMQSLCSLVHTESPLAPGTSAVEARQ